MKIRKLFMVLLSQCCCVFFNGFAEQGVNTLEFRAGAATATITPPLGTSINGNFQDATVSHVHDDTFVRALVLDDGVSQLAMATVDVCLLYREQIDRAKDRVSKYTGIPAAHIMVASTHTHSGGTTVSIFQSDPDPWYLDFVSSRIADAIILAYNQRVPARVGWGKGREEGLVFNRRWSMRAGTKLPNPFGGEDNVKMNPGIKNPDSVEPVGPVDPELYLLAVQSVDGTPLALWSNYSLHYVGGTKAGEVSADYFGYYARRISKMLGAEEQWPPFVGILSNGTSGDINNIDFSGNTPQRPGPYVQMEHVADKLAAEAHRIMQGLEYKDWVPLHALQEEITLGVRKPRPEEVTRAEKILENARKEVLTTAEEIYARETILLQAYPEKVSLPVQVFGIGELAVTALPVEVFVEVGLEIKARGPFKDTFTVTMANGYYGYLPTPEQHQLGGYETWRARSSYLEVQASTKLLERVFDLQGQLKQLSTAQRASGRP